MKCLHRFDWKAALLTTTTVQPDRIGLYQGNTVVADVLTVNIGMDTWHIVSLTHWPQSIPRTHIMDWVLEDFLWNRSQDTLNYKSTLVQVMACCRQAASHYLSKWWHGSMSLYGVTRPPLILRFFYQSAYQHEQSSVMMTSSNGNIFRVTGPLCGEFTGPGEFPAQRPVTRSFDVFFDLRLNKRLSKQPWGGWFETPSWSLWRQCNGRNTSEDVA